MDESDSIVEYAIALIATIPPSSPEGAADALTDAVWIALERVVFDPSDWVAEGDVRHALADAYLMRDADRVRKVMLDALARAVEIEPEDAVDRCLRVDGLRQAPAPATRRSRPS